MSQSPAMRLHSLSETGRNQAQDPPQSLSTLIFRRWSEDLSRGLVRGDSRKKNDLLHKDATYMSVSQLLAVQIHPESETGRKQAQDPPGSLSTLMFRRWSVSSVRGRSLR